MGSAKVFALANFSNETVSMGNNGQWVLQNLAPNNVGNTNEAVIPPFAPSDVMTYNWNNQTIAIWENANAIYWANWTTQAHTEQSGILLISLPNNQVYNLVLSVYGAGNQLMPTATQIG